MPESVNQSFDPKPSAAARIPVVIAHYEMGEHLRQDKVVNDARTKNCDALVAEADADEAALLPLREAEQVAHLAAADRSRTARVAESKAVESRREANTAIRLRQERTGA